MLEKKKTPAQWAEYLSSEHTPVTLDEYMAGCLARILWLMLESTKSAQHTEGMIGALDQFASDMAKRSGISYARTAKDREALQRWRDDQVALPAK